MTVEPLTAPSPESWAEISTLVNLIRSGRATTRPELAHHASLGRNIISARLRTLHDLGLVEVSGSAPSSGGRAPERLRFRGDQGFVLIAALGAAAMDVGVVDLSGEVIAVRHLEWVITSGPAATLEFVDQQFRALLEGLDEQRLWGIGVGVPGPVEHQTGRPVSPPIMPGWDGFDIRGWLAHRYPVGVWVDNDVNIMALGHRALHPDVEDLIYIKVGTGIGSGLLSGGRLHRGNQGAAGDIGHVRVDARHDVACRCGRMGCLEAHAGGWALERDAITAQVEGRSVYLTQALKDHGRITAFDVGSGARQAEPACVELISRSARHVGDVVSILVNFFNPEQVVIGGGVVHSGPLFLTIVERVVRERCLDLATEQLRVLHGRDDQLEGVIGAGSMVVDGLLAPGFIAAWADSGTPYDVEAIVRRKVQDEVGP